MERKKILFAADLDNTLIFSRRHRRPGDICVEYLDGAEQGFTTPEAWQDLLHAVSAAVTLLPVTTRSIAQYERIRWPDGARPAYAVTTNGGILLDRGVPDPDWLTVSLRLTIPYRPEFVRLSAELPKYPWCLRQKMVDGLYLFAVCPEGQPMEPIKALLQPRTSLTVESSGRKLYFFPPVFHKGAAVSQLRQRFQSSYLIAAGDSPLDLSMLSQADLALVPTQDLARRLPGINVQICPVSEPFPNFVLRSVLSFAARHA